MQSPEDRAMYKEVKEASVSLEPRESEGRTVRRVVRERRRKLGYATL